MYLKFIIAKALNWQKYTTETALKILSHFQWLKLTELSKFVNFLSLGNQSKITSWVRNWSKFTKYTRNIFYMIIWQKNRSYFLAFLCSLIWLIFFNTSIHISGLVLKAGPKKTANNHDNSGILTKGLQYPKTMSFRIPLYD